MKLTGQIVSGRARGRKIGFPTLNLDAHDESLKEGVYAVRVELAGENYSGVMNFGPRPTFGDYEPAMELHLFEFEENLLSGEVCVEVVSWIRGVQTFTSESELVLQIERDIENAKQILL